MGKKPELAEDSGLADALDAMQGRSSKTAGKQPSTPAKDTLAEAIWIRETKIGC